MIWCLLTVGTLPQQFFTDSQLLLWDARQQRALTQLRNYYVGGPQAALTVAQLAGDEPNDRLEDQSAELPRDTIANIQEAAQEVILQIPPAGAPEGIYTEIKQGLSEAFTSFMDRLMQAVDRQV